MFSVTCRNGITQCCLPAEYGLVLDLHTSEGLKAELTWVFGYIPR